MLFGFVISPESKKLIDVLRTYIEERPVNYGHVQQAIVELAELKEKHAVPYLITLLDKKEVIWVRESAITALAIIGDKTATKPLIGLLDDDDYHIVRQVTIALGDFKDPQVPVSLVDLLLSGNFIKISPSDYAVQCILSSTIGSLKKLGALSTEAAISLLQSPGVELRQKAISVLSDIKDKRSIEALCKSLLEDKISLIRKGVAEELKSVSDPSAINSLIKALEKHVEKVYEDNKYSNDVISELAEALVDFKTLAVKPLCTAYKNCNNIFLKILFAHLLEVIEKGCGLDLLVDDVKKVDINAHITNETFKGIRESIFISSLLRVNDDPDRSKKRTIMEVLDALK